MTRVRLFACCVVLLAIGCKKDATFTEPLPAYAHITWLNAVSDTGQLDVRIVDIPTSASGFMDLDFRTTQPFPLNIDPGTRHFKVFNSSSVDTIAKKVLLDTSYTFADDQPYSFELIGFARPGSSIPMHAVITNLTPATPGPGQFAIRVLNLAPSLVGSIRPIPDTTAHPDAFILPPKALPSTAAFTNLGFNAPSAYVNVDTGSYRLALTTTGTTDPMVVQAAIPPGVVGASGGTPGVAGSRIGGSVLTAIIVPRSVPASAAPQTRPTSLRTDTSTSQASSTITRSNDTVTVQVGSITILTNRRKAGGASQADSTLGRTGTAASSAVTAGGVILVSGANETEYNGWQEVLSVADTLTCSPADAGDVTTGNNRHCAPPADTTLASADTARTIFRFRYRIVGTPATPGTGTVVYRQYPANYTASDFATPQIIFVVDKRP